MPEDDYPAVRCLLGDILQERGITLVELSQRVGITYANLSKLKNGHARAVRFSTLSAICAELGCDVGDLFTVTGTAD